MKALPAFQENAVRGNAWDQHEVERILANLPGKETLADAIVVTGSATMLKGGKNIVKKLKLGEFGISFTLKNPNAIRFLAAKKTLELSNFRGNISNTTKDRVQAIIVSAVDSGASYQQTAELIRDQATSGIFSKARGEMIATREAGVAYEQGNKIPVDEFRTKNPQYSVIKYWQTVEDDRVTETHKQNQDDGWIDFGQAFSGTGDQQAPGSDNPRCRCFTKYDTKAS